MQNLEIPKFLRIPPEERKQAWEKNPPKPMPVFVRQRTEEELARMRAAEQFMAARKKGKAAIAAAKRKERSHFKPGSRWDTKFSRWVHPSEEKPTMMSITSNTRGKTPMKQPSEMSGPELVAAYNVLAPKVGAKIVAKFSDHKTGVRRLEELRKQVSEAPVKSNGKSERAPKNAHERMLFDFDVRPGTNREKVMNKLIANKGKPVPRKELLKAVYGTTDEKNVGALSMVFKGLQDKIKTGRLQYTITKGKTEEKEVTYAFDSK